MSMNNVTSAIDAVMKEGFAIENDEPANLTGPQALVDFARKTPDGGTWHYEFTGTMSEAKRFVQAFRVQLSRVRDRARELQRPFIPFKTKAKYQDLENGKIMISIHRSGKEIEAMRALDKVLDSITI